MQAVQSFQIGGGSEERQPGVEDDLVNLRTDSPRREQCERVIDDKVRFSHYRVKRLRLPNDETKRHCSENGCISAVGAGGSNAEASRANHGRFLRAHRRFGAGPSVCMLRLLRM